MNSKTGHDQIMCMRDMCDMCCASSNMMTDKKIRKFSYSKMFIFMLEEI